MKKVKVVIKLIFVILLIGVIGTMIAADYFYNMALNPKADKEIVMDGNTAVRTVTKEADTFNYKQWLLDESGWVESYWTSYDGLRLHRYEIPLKVESDRYAVVVHGYTMSAKNMGAMAKYFYDHKYHVILPELRGHGKSEGNYIAMGWHDRLDLLDVINQIQKENPKARIVLAGVSMGAASVLMVSGEELPKNVKAVISDSAYTSVWEEFSFELNKLFNMPKFPIMHATSTLTKIRAGYRFKEASALQQVKKSETPTLFIHGSNDNFVPLYMVEELYNACNAEKEKLIIEGADHAQALDVAPKLYKQRVQSFLNKYGM